jgi:hypothetical protein
VRGLIDPCLQARPKFLESGKFLLYRRCDSLPVIECLGIVPCGSTGIVRYAFSGHGLASLSHASGGGRRAGAFFILVSIWLHGFDDPYPIGFLLISPAPTVKRLLCHHNQGCMSIVV